jgi:hypothetical protein
MLGTVLTPLGPNKDPTKNPANEGVSDFSLSRERLHKLSKDRFSSKSPIERFVTSPIEDGNEPSPEVIEAACKEQKSVYRPQTSQSRPNSFDSGHGYRTSGLDSGDAASTSSAGSMHSSRSNSSFRSNASSEFRRKRKSHSRSLAAMQQNPRRDICVELECTDCETNMAFLLTPQPTTITCLDCHKDLGNFSVAYGRSASFIKVGCPNAGCNHQNYQTTTKEAKDTILKLTCLCEQYSPRLLLSDWKPFQEYHCTYCDNSYKSKYGWERHETTKHRPREVWICCSSNPLQDNACIFCFQQNPTMKHFKNHSYDRCHQRGVSLRTYSRKDQFMQHLRTFHRCAIIHEELVVQWRRELNNVEQSWRCGICEESFLRWSERLKHIGKHWEQGLSMSDWKVEKAEWKAHRTVETQGVVLNDVEEREAPKNRLSVQGLWNMFTRVLPKA